MPFTLYVYTGKDYVDITFCRIGFYGMLFKDIVQPYLTGVDNWLKRSKVMNYFTGQIFLKIYICNAITLRSIKPFQCLKKNLIERAGYQISKSCKAQRTLHELETRSYENYSTGYEQQAASY